MMKRGTEVKSITPATLPLLGLLTTFPIWLLPTGVKLLRTVSSPITIPVISATPTAATIISS